MSRRAALYDDDDFDDGYYDEDEEWDEEEEAEKSPVPVPVPVKPKAAKPAPKPAPPKAPAAAAGKPLPQAAAIKQQPQPLVPGGDQAAADVQRFQFDQPSPDDAVLAAQRGRLGGAHQGPPPSAAATPPPAEPAQQPVAAGGAAARLQGLSLGEGPSASSEQQQQQASLAVPSSRPLSEYQPDAELRRECERAAAAEASAGGKPKLHLVVLGHVDAGKSTLMGRMLYELGLIADKQVHKTQREAAVAGKGSFAWAWMLDERPEERARGVTVDIAITRFETPARNVTLLDAPGHRDFVPNMITGAAQADAALLVVDGSPGGFEAGFETAVVGGAGGGQTREHAQLARSLGVEQLAVVITKLDTCDCSEERFNAIKATLEPFLKTCGFRPSAIQWLPAVGPTGDNLAAPPKDPALAAWWRGPTLAQAIDAFRPAHRLLEKPLRMPVADVQRSGKANVLVGGKLEGGGLVVGSRVLVMPSGQAATVKSIEVDGKPAPLARAGDSADVVLAGVDTTAVGAGSVLCHPDFPVPLAAKFEARVVVLDVPVPLLHGAAVTLHAHTARESGNVTALAALLDAKTGEEVRKRPRCLLKGQSAVVEVTPARPLCVEDYADCRPLGRIALRDGGRTVAVGIVTEVKAAAQVAAAVPQR